MVTASDSSSYRSALPAVGCQQVKVEGWRTFAGKGDESPHELRNMSSDPTYYIRGILPGDKEKSHLKFCGRFSVQYSCATAGPTCCASGNPYYFNQFAIPFKVEVKDCEFTLM